MDFLKKVNILLLLGSMYLPCSAQTAGGYVLVPKGSYHVGLRHHGLNPARSVSVDSFYIAACETTNRQFAAFVAATGYVTDAEQRHDALVFAPGLREFEWNNDSTACWRFPNGVAAGGINDKWTIR